MPINVQNPLVQRLFNPVQPPTTPNPYITKGSLILFNYSFWQHDPVPLVIVTDFNIGQRIRGVNLHYLTFPYIRNVLTLASNNMSFSYNNIRSDSYITGAFRTYKWNGVSRIKKFDSQFIMKMMTIARAFDPAQIQAIRQSVDQQIQQELVSPAQPTPERPFSV